MQPMTTGTEEDRKRLGRLIKAAREAKGWTHTQAADKSGEDGRRGIKRMAWIRVEQGHPARGMTYRAIENALDLEPGACDAVLEGAETLMPRMKIHDVSGQMAQGVVALIASVDELDEVSLRAILKTVTTELDRRGAERPSPGNGAAHK
jgi:transcriptional regulator with XRE-family HTH domain